jgi:hypothetical protein
VSDRLAYRIAEVCQLAGVSRWAVERAISRSEIRTKRVGRVVLLDPMDVSRVFGFSNDGEDLEPSAESIDEMNEFLS